MTAAESGSSRSFRSRQRRRGWLLALALLTLIGLLTGSVIRESRVALRSHAERSFVRQASLITDNLAARLFDSHPGPEGKSPSAGVLTLEPEQFRSALAHYPSLQSIAVAADDLRIIHQASRSATTPEAMVSRFKSLGDASFPPVDGDVSVVRQPDRIFTAGRIEDAPGIGRAILFLEFETDVHIRSIRAALLTLCGLLLYGILLWALLEGVIRQSVLQPVAALRRLHAAIGRGNWTRRIVPTGSTEIRSVAETTNATIERATRLWDTIEWRRRHIETHAPDKAEAARQIATTASRHKVFGAPLLPLPFRGSGTRSVAAWLLLLCEVGALIELVLAFGPQMDAAMGSGRWRSALLLVTFGVGLMAGARASHARGAPTPGPATLIATAVLSTGACLLVATLNQHLAVLLVSRAAAGFAVGFAVNIRIARITERMAHRGFDDGHAASQPGAVLALVVFGPLLGLLAINYPPEQVFFALAALSALAALLATGSAFLDPAPSHQADTAARHNIAEPGASPGDVERLVRSNTSIPANLNRLLSSPGQAPLRPRPVAPGLRLAAILIVAVTLLQAISLGTIEIDEASRFLGICFMLAAVTAGACLPDAIGRRAPLVALGGLSAIIVPMLLMQMIATISVSTQTTLMASGTALLAGCMLALAAKPIPPNTPVAGSGLAPSSTPVQHLRGSDLPGWGFLCAGLLGAVSSQLNEASLVAASTVTAVLVTLIVLGRAPADGLAR